MLKNILYATALSPDSPEISCNVGVRMRHRKLCVYLSGGRQDFPITELEDIP